MPPVRPPQPRGAGGPPPPPAAPPPGGDDEGFRPPAWAYGVIAVVILALVAVLGWRLLASDDDGDPGAPTTEPTIAPTVPPTATMPSQPGATTTGGSPPGAPTPGPATTAPVVTNPDGSPVTNPDGSPVTVPPTAAPGVPPATTAPASPPTAAPPASPPTVAPPPAGTTPAGTPPLSTPALRLAQDMATALANGDWTLARRISPTDTRTIAEFERDYAGLVASTVVPSRETTLPNGLVDLRLGLVADETRPTGPQTSLFCAHWVVDTRAGTVQRVAAGLVRTLAGTVPVAQVAPELSATCATYPFG